MIYKLIFKNKIIIIECNHNKCATCVSENICIIPCQEGCSLCNAKNECSTAKKGYYVDPNKDTQSIITTLYYK